MERQTKILELEKLINDLEGKDKATPEQLTLMFNLHNYFNPRHPEYSKHCGSCVARTYRNIKSIYQSVKDEINN